MSTTQLSEALRQLLRELPARIPAERIDRIWLFAPREINGRESGLLVLSLLDPGADAAVQRQVVTWRYEAASHRGRLSRTDVLEEQGRAPADMIDRLIEGVLGRMGDVSETPLMESVGGDPGRWAEVLASLGVDAG